MRRVHNLFRGLTAILSFATAMFCSATLKAQAQVKSDQLVGDWVHVGPSDMKGLSFSKDGKVASYYAGGSQAMTSDFSILGDGRLDISEGGVLHNFFLPTLSGDQLQLRDPQSGKTAQFRRLKTGETMVAAIATEDKGMQQEVQVRNASVPAFLMRQDLVLVSTTERANAPEQRGIVGEDLRPTVPTPAALQFVPNGAEYGGRVYYDTKPPRLDAVGAQIQNPQSDTPTVAIWFGLGTAAQNRGTLFFHPAGTAPNITLTYSVTKGSPPVLVIKPDPAMHAQIIEHIKTEAARLNSLKTPVLAMIKDFVVLKGGSQSILPAERKGFADQFTLSRNPQNNSWMGQGRLTNLTTGATESFPVMAGVGIMNNKPVIEILSQKRRYQFNVIDTTSGRLDGTWQQPNFPQAKLATLTVVQALDAKSRDQRFASRKAALQQLGSYHGLVADLRGGRPDPPNPVSVTLSSASNNGVTGTVEYPLQGFTMNLAGRVIDTPFGPQIQLQYKEGKTNPGAWPDAPSQMKAVERETWVLGPAGDSSGPMQLEGFAVQNPAPNATLISLQLSPNSDKDKTALLAALGAKTHLKLMHPEMAGPDDILDCSVDASGKPAFVLASGGSRLNNAPGTSFTGEMKDAGGWNFMDTPIVRPRYSGSDYGFKIFAGIVDGSVYLNAYTYSTHTGAVLGRWDAVQVKQ